MDNAKKYSRQSQEEEKHQILSKDTWTTFFADRLLSTGSSTIIDSNSNDTFVLLENVMESLENDFCNCLRQELEVFLEKLRPARTRGERSQLQENRQQQQQQQAYSSNNDSVRGDRNLFIDREYRQRKCFAIRHPYLNRLISTISNTLEREFDTTNKRDGCSSHTCVDSRLKLDLSMTSVQVALYPGDGKSGYRRHCDQHKSCKEEESEITETEVLDRQMYLDPLTPKSNERILTAIYYLTDADWNAKLDGGALRIFHPSVKAAIGENGSYSSSLYTDIVPFRDRMLVFRSDLVEHQVMPSLRRPRLAITLWFYGTIEKLSTNSDSIIIENDEPLSSHGPHIPPSLPIGSPPSPLSSIVSSAAGFDNNSVPTIFVSIASYRDSETRPTLDALFSKAQNPRRIFVGIVVQLVEKEKDDEDIWKSILAGTSKSLHSWKPQPHQVRYIRLNARDATGPCYARGLCQSLFRGEDYVMQIDSHMRFRQNWDEYLIQTIQGIQEYHQTSSDKGIPNNKIVLTTYPLGYTLPNNIPQETRGTYLVPWKFDKNGMLRQRGRLFRSSVDQTDIGECNPNLHKAVGEHPLAVTHHARQHYLYAGGFNFGFAQLITDVPYDLMGMHHLFFGEEMSMSVRLFTHGYFLYAPNETVCYHLWSRAHRPTTTGASTTTDYKQRLQELSRDKVKNQLLGDQSLIGKSVGLGKIRSAAAFADKIGVNFRRQTFVRMGGEFDDENGMCSRLVFPEDSVEAKVASLDTKAQELIGMFLMGINN